jgi:hypothetical protein
MRALCAVVILSIAGAVGVELASASTAAKPVSLTVTYWPDEQKPAEFERWTLRCNPPNGTLPTRKRACAKLLPLPKAAFARVPDDAICTQIYGGPQKAVVKGTFGSSRIWVSFRRRNGCEIDRWARFSPWLLPAPEGTR